MTTTRLKRRRSRGVTLVEIAIVLAAVGLMLGAVLKSQELINNAKVRAIVEQQLSLKVAFNAFSDRYEALPGDYERAEEFIPGAQDSGDGNGYIGDSSTGVVFAHNQTNEAVNAMQHMTGAGLLRCPQCIGDGGPSFRAALLTGDNSLVNHYGGVMGVMHFGRYAGLGYYAALGPVEFKIAVMSGAHIPSNILAEVDRKIDDGYANDGAMRFAEWRNNLLAGTAPSIPECMAQNANPTTSAQARGGTTNNTAPQIWRSPLARPPIEGNCGAAFFI